MAQSTLPEQSEKYVQKLNLLRDNLSGVIRGKSESIDMMMVALLSNGSVLMEDVPGTGKTTLAKALARSLDVSLQSCAVYARPAADRYPGILNL